MCVPTVNAIVSVPLVAMSFSLCKCRYFCVSGVNAHVSVIIGEYPCVFVKWQCSCVSVS